MKSDVITMNDGEPLSIISIEGELAVSGQQKFINEAIRASHAVVVFNSPGGSTVAGIEIGKAIRLKGFATLVPEEFICASACALAWLGGVPRMMSARAHLGFHATYVDEGGHAEVSSAGNALVGAYLGQIGLSSPAIAYLSQAQPADMLWLTLSDAKRIGLEVEPFELAASTSADSPAAAKSDERRSVDWSAKGNWIQLYSRASYADAVLLAEGLVDKFPNTSVFLYDNGWYVVAIGPYPADTARQLRDQYLAARVIPNDAFMNPGRRFVDRVWPANPPTPAASDPEAAALVAANAFLLKARLQTRQLWPI